MTARPRRRILCVRPRQNPKTSPFLMALTDEWVHALRLHADVSSIESDFDFEQVCRETRPDFVLFDCAHLPRPDRLRIANSRAHPHIPRAMLMHCDPHDWMRPLTFQALDEYGIDTIFQYGNNNRQFTPEFDLIDCFTTFLTVDGRVFHDYGLPKIIPMTIISGHLEPKFYPWRAQLTAQIQHVLPTLIYTHPGYENPEPSPFIVTGEQYAKLLNQSHFAAADTTRLDTLVRKHLEIPAVGTVLIAPDSVALAEHGFVDGENCVLGTGAELYAKMLQIAHDPDQYEAIRKAGHDLVQSRYTMPSWTTILDWYECRRSLRPGEKVQQHGMFGAFHAVPAAGDPPGVIDCPVVDNAMARVLRAARDAILHDGDLAAAEQNLLAVTDWLHHIAEPWFLLGIIAMLRGEADRAVQFIGRRVTEAVRSYPQWALPDPVEVAYLMLVADLGASSELLAMARNWAVDKRHLAIRRTLWLLAAIRGNIGEITDELRTHRPGDWLSIHWIGQESFADWLRIMRRTLAAFGKIEAAQTLNRFSTHA